MAVRGGNVCVCVCVCVFFLFILDIKFVGRTSRDCKNVYRSKRLGGNTVWLEGRKQLFMDLKGFPNVSCLESTV